MMIQRDKQNNRKPASWPGSYKQSDEHYHACLPAFQAVLEDELLNQDLLPLLKTIYLPLAGWIADKHQQQPIVIGINGAQGSGKSTLSKLLTPLLKTAFNKSVLELSIDDLYLSRQQRLQLAETVHPLLAVRGVPGTHDVELGEKILLRLKSADLLAPLTIPVFDKAQDDLLSEERWLIIEKPVDIILFEGWCVAAKPQHETELEQPVNQLEANNDADAIWRHYVNQQLAGPYQSMFSHIDYLLMLKVPDMNSVFDWRLLQEQKLAEQCRKNHLADTHIMSSHEIKRFIMHYERVTRHILNEMPGRADVLLELDKQHRIRQVLLKHE